MLQMIDDLDLRAKRGERRLIDEAQALLDRFEADALRGGVPQPRSSPRAMGWRCCWTTRRALLKLDPGTWSVLVRRQLLDGRDISVARIRDFRARAAAGGAAIRPLDRFLTDLIARIEAGRAHRRRGSGGWGWKVAGFVLALVRWGWRATPPFWNTAFTSASPPASTPRC